MRFSSLSENNSRNVWKVEKDPDLSIPLPLSENVSSDVKGKLASNGHRARF